MSTPPKLTIGHGQPLPLPWVSETRQRPHGSELIPVSGQRAAIDGSHKPSSSCQYSMPGLQSPSQPQGITVLFQHQIISLGDRRHGAQTTCSSAWPPHMNRKSFVLLVVPPFRLFLSQNPDSLPTVFFLHPYYSTHNIRTTPYYGRQQWLMITWESAN